tara:strand:- start:1647 stop:1898 length:252 start_codon:yes stop_codon:yes gene_type:complete
MNPIKNSYIEGWDDRNSVERPSEVSIPTSIEKDWLKSNSAAFLESLERKWEWRYEQQLALIRTLEANAVKLRKEIRTLKKDNE